jgi:5-formyltetrahydrofolate cyclo-ligase
MKADLTHSPDELAVLRAHAKRQLRKQLLAVRRVLPASVVAERSAKACERLLSLPQLTAATTILAYVAMRKEIDPSAVLAHAFATNKRVVLPRIGDEGLALHEHHEGVALIENHLGVQEPSASAARVEPSAIDLVIVPALAVDPRGYRVGYGGGFYDRLLPQMTNATKVAFVYDFQLVSEAPNEAHDAQVTHIISDARTLVAASES